MNYGDKVMEHFMNPRNVGELDNPDGVGQVGSVNCGDIMRMTIRVEDNRIADINFKTFGCGAAIAVSSMVTEMARGKNLDDAVKIKGDDVAAALGGLSHETLHCSNLGTDALKAAVNDYWKKNGKAHMMVPLKDEHLAQETDQNGACCDGNERGCGQSSCSSTA